MGILDFAEKAAGALAAEKGLEAADPNAGFIEKAAAAVAGYEGVAALKEHFDKPADPAPAAVPVDPDAQPATDDGSSGQ